MQSFLLKGPEAMFQFISFGEGKLNLCLHNKYDSRRSGKMAIPSKDGVYQLPLVNSVLDSKNLVTYLGQKA